MEPPACASADPVRRLSDGDRVLDVGCGTGSLSFVLPEFAKVSAVAGVDLAQGYVEFARTCNTDSRITFQQADACSLPFEDKSFDRAFSMLVLHFIPDSARAVGEMRRVVPPGGTVTAAVWDEYGGLPHYRMLVDIAATLDPSVERHLISAPYRSGRNGEPVARSWNAQCRTDQSFDPHGV
jgi:ubiquinone/menaquinone biosynthesis C-methylase UbiE